MGKWFFAAEAATDSSFIFYYTYPCSLVIFSLGCSIRYFLGMGWVWDSILIKRSDAQGGQGRDDAGDASPIQR